MADKIYDFTVKLETPWAGWSSLEITDSNNKTFHCPLSYIDDVVDIFLSSFEAFIRDDQDVVLHFDGEGPDSYIILCHHDFLKAIFRGKEIYIEEMKIWISDFIPAILDALEADLKAWSEFGVFAATEKEYKSESNSNLKKYKERIENIRKLLAEKQK